MAKKKTASKLNKSAEIRAYLKANPGVKNAAAAAALKKRGLDVSPQYISVVKTNAKKSSGKPAKRGRPAKAFAASTSDVSLESIKQAKKLADQMGGVERAKKALDALAELIG